MNRGFYTLGSGMITNNRSLSSTSNNLANVMTVGFKKTKVVSSTFDEMMMYRMANDPAALGPVTMLRSASESVSIHSQGVLKSTDRSLDFAISGSGFFAVQSNNGSVYTRNGNFSIDSEGYLTLDHVGRVIGENGPIQINTNNIEVDEQGNIYADSAPVDKIAVYDFKDYKNLLVAGEGMYSANTETPILSTDAKILQKTLEMSNVDTASEMTDAITEQRSLQACAQALKMYDENLSKSVSEIGRI